MALFCYLQFDYWVAAANIGIPVEAFIMSITKLKLNICLVAIFWFVIFVLRFFGLVYFVLTFWPDMLITVISDDELRRIIELCLEQQEHLVGLESNHENLDICLTQAEGMIRNVELRLETEETLEKIDLIEERISTLNNVKNGLEQDYLNQLELRNNRNVTEFNEAEKVRQIQTKIEAQLYLNLQ